MKKILLLPLLNSMPSGHHQAAKAIEEYITGYSEEIECKKVDLLSEWNAGAEKAIVKFYLSWIRHAPALYSLFYRISANKPAKKTPSHPLYDFLFLDKMEQIIAEEKPDLIICTHAFASYFINKLKQMGKCPMPCVNVYTDFFINDLWGKSEIEYHFVPSLQVKSELQSSRGIQEENVFITGIPVSLKFDEQLKKEEENGRLTMLIFGGNKDLSNLVKSLKSGNRNRTWDFQILTSKNEISFKKAKAFNSDTAEILPDISSKEKMNHLYSNADAFVTKPGGVSISEALRKNVPIFIHSALPGQEKINLNYLSAQKLVFEVPENENLVDFVEDTLSDKEKMREHKEAVQRYRDSLTLRKAEEIFFFIKKASAAGNT